MRVPDKDTIPTQTSAFQLMKAFYVIYTLPYCLFSFMDLSNTISKGLFLMMSMCVSLWVCAQVCEGTHRDQNRVLESWS